MIAAIVPAAGQGTRIGGGKLFLKLGNKPLLLRTAELLQNVRVIELIVFVFREQEIEHGTELIQGLRLSTHWKSVIGGAERQDSVYNAISELPSECTKVIVHDAARPLVSTELFWAGLSLCDSNDGAVPAVPLIDTVKAVDGHGMVTGTLDRSILRLIQTPQSFNAVPLIESHKKAKEEGFTATDDAALLERYGYKVMTFPGESENIKITREADLRQAESIWENRRTEAIEKEK